MSENAVERVAKLLNDTSYETWTNTDMARALSKQGIRLHYVELNTIGTRVFEADDTLLDFETDRDRQWIDNEFVLYDGEYNVIVPDTADVENGKFHFNTEPTNLPIYIVSTSYCPYNAAADLILEQAYIEAGEPASFSTQNGSFSFSGASDIRSQAMAYRRKGRKVYAL